MSILFSTRHTHCTRERTLCARHFSIKGENNNTILYYYYAFEEKSADERVALERGAPRIADRYCVLGKNNVQ